MVRQQLQMHQILLPGDNLKQFLTLVLQHLLVHRPMQVLHPNPQLRLALSTQ
jgi:hypothetical protein